MASDALPAGNSAAASPPAAAGAFAALRGFLTPSAAPKEKPLLPPPLRALPCPAGLLGDLPLAVLPASVLLGTGEAPAVPLVLVSVRALLPAAAESSGSLKPGLATPSGCMWLLPIPPNISSMHQSLFISAVARLSLLTSGLMTTGNG